MMVLVGVCGGEGKKRRNGLWLWLRWFVVLACLVLWAGDGSRVLAARADGANGTEQNPAAVEGVPQDGAAAAGARPRLVQATTPEEEWEAVTALDILQVLPVEESEGLLKAEGANLSSVVRIDTGHYIGSGVIFEITEESVFIVSNRHLLEYDEGARVTFPGGFETGASGIVLSDRYDMGIVEVACERVPFEVRMGLKRVCWNNECSARAESGDSLFIIGSLEGPGANVYEGTLADSWWYSEDFGTHMLYNYCNAEHGISGGGTFDAHGHYLGMLSAGNGTETLSLPVVTILEEYGELKQAQSGG